MDIVRTVCERVSQARSRTRARRGIAKAVTAAVMLAVTVLGSQETALAETGRQRFHITYAGPFDPADPPARPVIAVGPIEGRAIDLLISQGLGPEPNTFESAGQMVFPEGTLFLAYTGTFEFRFNAHACRATTTVSGNWVITGGTGAYTGATGQGTFRGRNILTGKRTPNGCPPQADRMISNLSFVGTSTVPSSQAA